MLARLCPGASDGVLPGGHKMGAVFAPRLAGPVPAAVGLLRCGRPPQRGPPVRPEQVGSSRAVGISCPRINHQTHFPPPKVALCVNILLAMQTLLAQPQRRVKSIACPCRAPAPFGTGCRRWHSAPRRLGPVTCGRARPCCWTTPACRWGCALASVRMPSIDSRPGSAAVDDKVQAAVYIPAVPGLLLSPRPNLAHMRARSGPQALSRGCADLFSLRFRGLVRVGAGGSSALGDLDLLQVRRRYTVYRRD